ncbi:hypothetical protein GW17_00002450 [Ensete ventricosum]|nr:hypothetical protein GW17_00002450 [Ensete ventricosum]
MKCVASKKVLVKQKQRTVTEPAKCDKETEDGLEYSASSHDTKPQLEGESSFNHDYTASPMLPVLKRRKKKKKKKKKKHPKERGMQRSVNISSDYGISILDSHGSPRTYGGVNSWGSPVVFEGLVPYLQRTTKQEKLLWLSRRALASTKKVNDDIQK